MAKFTIRYECTEYYEKTYDADSFDEAEKMYFMDDKLFESTPYESNMELIEVVDEDGLCE